MLNIINTQIKTVQSFAQTTNYLYICNVFFMVLDLRLTKIGCRETTIFFVYTFIQINHIYQQSVITLNKKEQLFLYTINIYHKKLIFANTQKKDYILILTEQIHQSNKVQQHSFFEASLFNKIPIKLIPPIIKTYSQNYHHINRYTAVSQYH